MKKITRIEHIIHKDEVDLMRINFYHYQERLVQVEKIWYPSDSHIYDYSYVFDHAGRVEVFKIAEDEQLIGCELDQDEDHDKEEDHDIGQR